MPRLGQKIIVWILASVSFVICGCFDAVPSKPGVYVASGKKVFIRDMQPDDVIVRVNGVKITKKDYDHLERIYEIVFRLSRKLPLEGISEEAAKYTHANEQRVPESLITHELLRQEAERRKIVPEGRHIDAACAKFCKTIRCKPENFSEVAAKVAKIDGAVGGIFADIPRFDAVSQLLRESETTNDLSTVTDEDVKARERFVKAFDENADRENKAAREKLLRAKQKILAGKFSFADMSRNISEVHPEYGEAWETVELGEVPPDSDLYKWLKGAKVGDISDPLDLDDGLAIVKLVELGKGDAPEGTEKPTTYKLVRCTRFAREHMTPQTPEEMRKQLLFWRNQAIQCKLVPNLFNAAVIEFPNGTNFYPAVASTLTPSQDK